MRTLKIVLSWVAAAVGIVGAGANVVGISPAVSGLLLAGANLIAMEGIPAAVVTPAMARVFGLVSSAAFLLAGAHAAGQVFGPPAAYAVLFKVIGVIGLMFGLAGKNPLTGTAPPAQPKV